MNKTMLIAGCVVLSTALLSCRGAIPLPPPWLLFIENPHSEQINPDALPSAIANSYPHLLPEPVTSFQTQTVAWVDLNADFSRHPVRSKSRGYHPSTR